MKIYNIITGDDPSTVREIRAFLNSMYSWDKEVSALKDVLKHKEQVKDEVHIEQIKRWIEGTPKEVTDRVLVKSEVPIEYIHTILMNLATEENGAYKSDIKTRCFLLTLDHLTHKTTRFDNAHDLINSINEIH